MGKPALTEITSAGPSAPLPQTAPIMRASRPSLLQPNSVQAPLHPALAQRAPITHLQLSQYLPPTHLLSERAQVACLAARLLRVDTRGLLIGYYRVDLLPALSSLPPCIPSLLLNADRPGTANSPSQPVPINPTSDHSKAAKQQHTLDLQEAYKLLREACEHAYTPMYCFEGPPAQEDGSPFWNRLPYEDPLAYEAFQSYIQQGFDGPRLLSDLTTALDTLDTLSNTCNIPLQELQELYVMHYWPFRAKAFDLFKSAALRYERNQRVHGTKEAHYLISTKLLEKTVARMSDDDFLNDLTPREGIEMVKTLAAMQRVALDMPANAPQENPLAENHNASRDFQETMDDIVDPYAAPNPNVNPNQLRNTNGGVTNVRVFAGASTGGPNGGHAGVGAYIGVDIDNDPDGLGGGLTRTRMLDILKDPDAAAHAQELLIHYRSEPDDLLTDDPHSPTPTPNSDPHECIIEHKSDD